MSGGRPTVGIRISAEGADQVKRQLEALGPAGERAFAQIQAASRNSQPEFQKLGTSVDVVQRAFIGMGGSLGSVGSVFTGVSAVAGGLTTAIVALGAAAATSAVAIAKAGDEATATMARLASSTGGVAQATQVYEQLFKLSQQTGVAVAESAGAFSRFAVAAREIGGTNAQVLQLVGGIQKAGIVAGTSAAEAAASVQQLGQALASGALQGDELRSLLENMPQLAQALSRELGVSIGQLRQMGSEGKLTADTVFPALLRATEKISAEFDKMPVTMSRAKDILLAATQDFGERLDRITGLSQTFARFMQQGAAALNAAGRYIAPTDQEATSQSISRLETERDRLRERSSNAESEINAYMASGLSRQQALSLAMPALPGQSGAGDGARLAAIEKELAEHYDRRFRMQLDAQTREQAEQLDADRQAQESARQRAQTAFDKLRTDLDKEFKLRKEHEERLKVIQRAEATGAITSTQAAAQRKLANDELAEGLKKLEDGHKAVAKAADDADAHVKEYLKEQKRLADEAAKAQEKAAEEIRRYHERSFDAVVSIAERAFDRVGDAIVQAFVLGEGSAVNFSNVARAVLASVVTDFAKLAIINPIANSLFTGTNGPRPTLAGAFGSGGGGLGLGDVLGLSSLIPKDGLLGALGISGASGWMASANASLFGTAGVSPATASLFMDASGVAASPVAGTSGILGSGGIASIGGVLGAAGLGFGAGNLLNTLVGGNQTGGMVGSALGTGAGIAAALALNMALPGVGTLLALLGGAAGGGLGGLFGPGPSVQGYGFRLQSAGYGPDATPANAMASSLLPIDRTFYNDSGAQMFAAADQLVAATNAYLAARGLTVGGVSIVGGNKNGADYSWADAGNLNEAFTRLRFGAANDNQLAGALTGKTFSDLGGLQQFVEGFTAVRDTIRNLTETPAQALARQLQAIGKQFDDLSAKAKEYGLSEEGLADARQKALDAVKAQQNNEGQSIRAYLARLDVADPTRAPVDRFGSAQSQFDADLAAARSGDSAALRRITGSADTLLGAGRTMYASGPEFAALRAMVTSSLSGLADQIEVDAASIAMAETATNTAQTVQAVKAAETTIQQTNTILAQIYEAQRYGGSDAGGDMGAGGAGGSSGSGGMQAALGAVFAGGNVIPFARGGIPDLVTSPTYAPMALFGEAGPEAIMPLRRGADGRLGVEMSGGGIGALAGVLESLTMQVNSLREELRTARLRAA